MCYDPQTSINAFSIGVVSALSLFVIGWKSNDSECKALGIFFIFVALMQFWDYMFWTTDSGSETNKWATRGAIITNNIQPIILASLTYFIVGKIAVESKYATMIYAILIIPYTMYCLRSVESTELSEHKIPNWKWNHEKNSGLVYALYVLAAGLVLFQNYSSLTGILCFVLIMANLIFSIVKWSYEDSVGRYWCYLSAFSPIILSWSKMVSPN